MTKFADLHIHTYYSDSTASPQEVIRDSLQADLSCIAITDHDTLDGVQPAQEAAQDSGLEVIAGIELSSEINGKDVHILGYCIDPDHAALKEQLYKMQSARIERIRIMIQKLNALGINNIELEEVCILTKSRSVGRPHLATILLQKGWVGSLGEAFNRYLGEGCSAYAPKYKQSPYEAIELIRQAGGVSVMAHPMLTQLDELIPGFVKAGLQGIEAVYPNCPQAVISHYEGIAKKHNLLVTGGSDAHGQAKKHTFIGKQKIPYEYVELLKNESQRVRHEIPSA